MCFFVVTLVPRIQHFSKRGPSWLAPEGCLCPSVHRDSVRPLLRIGPWGAYKLQCPCRPAGVSLVLFWDPPRMAAPVVPMAGSLGHRRRGGTGAWNTSPEFQLLLFLASSLAATGPQGFLHHRTVPGCLTCPGRGEDPALGGGGAHAGLPGGPGVPRHASTQAQLVLGPLHGRRAPLGASLMCSPGIRPYPSTFVTPHPRPLLCPSGDPSLPSARFY